MGYAWDEVHDEAEVLEHSISDRLLEAINARLGFPVRDPHGDPIPFADGTVSADTQAKIKELTDGIIAGTIKVNTAA